MRADLPPALVAELAALAPADLAALLKGFNATERALIRDALGGDPRPALARGRQSPWMEALQAEAAEVLAGGLSSRLTRAAAEALAEPSREGVGIEATPRASAGPSLLQGLRQALPAARKGR